ncbi:MAG: Fic family protein [Bacteroidales bacterium]|nr:Fic family protein [Bacteroidales bacterium]
MDSSEKLIELIQRYKQLGIDSQIDYEKFYLYSIITHSTAIEGSTVTEIENQLLFDEGLSAGGKPIREQMMNLDLKAAYEDSIRLAKSHTQFSVEMLKNLSRLVMQHTGSTYKTALGEFSSAEGDLRLVNVTAGVGGRSYMSFQKVPEKLQEFCNWVNSKRLEMMSVAQKYDFTFETHYRLVTIHPWADGNGRMARLIMNYLQFEFGLIPSKVLKEERGAYINALIETREKDDITIFKKFMTNQMIRTLSDEIDLFLKSTENENFFKEERVVYKKVKTRDKILQLLSANPKHTTQKLAQEIGITTKAVEKQLAKLKAESLLRRDGPDKGGRWVVI